jgi:hypothetical protein
MRGIKNKTSNPVELLISLFSVLIKSGDDYLNLIEISSSQIEKPLLIRFDFSIILKLVKQFSKDILIFINFYGVLFNFL